MSRAPFSRYGGKYYMLKTIIPLLPPHDVWVEAFAGAAWVTLAKPPSAVEVINDLDEGVVNFYRVLRDPDQMRALEALLTLTPYSRAEYIDCRGTWSTQTDPVEKARRWFVTVRQSVVGNIGTTGWSYSVQSHVVTRWRNSIAGFGAVHERLALVQVDQRDWRVLLAAWNKPGVLLYCDPPYVLDTRVKGPMYAHEMTDDDHRDLVTALLGWQGPALVSGYAHPIYAPLELAGWQRIDKGMPAHSTGSTRAGGLKQGRTESLWINYATSLVGGSGL